MSNNTRSLRNRSSRFSSPATFTTVNQEGLVPVQEESTALQGSAANGVDKQSQSQVQHGPWVEPVVRNGVPSFEDTKGLERVGVLEHMQPLGAPPNPKILQRLKVNLGGRASLGSARATPVFSEEVASPASQPMENARHDLHSPVIDPELLDTPSPPVLQAQTGSQSLSPFQSQSIHVPPPPPAQSLPVAQPESPSYQLPPPSTQQFSPVSQTRYTPTMAFPPLARPDSVPMSHSQQPSSQVIMSPPRGRPAKKEVEEMRAYNPDDSMMSSAMASIMRPSRASPRYSSSSISEQSRGDRFRASLQNAITRAVAEGKPEIEAGLKRVLQESGRDELTTALDNISKYKANVPINQFKVFKHFVKKGIRKHRKYSTGSSLSSNNDPAPSPPPSQPAAYISTFRTKRPTPPEGNDSARDEGRSPLTLRYNQFAASNNNRVLNKSTSQSPERLEVPDQVIDASFPPKMTSRKRRSSSTSSLSSLSSANLSDYAPPEMAVPVRDQPSEGRPARSTAQRQAAARTAAGRPTRSSGIGTDSHSQTDSSSTQPSHPNYTGIEAVPSQRGKKLKLNHPDPVNDDEIARQKERYSKSIVRDSAYEELTSFSRTPSPTRRTKNKAQDEERRKRGFSPKSSGQQAGPPPPVIHPEALVSSANFEASSPISAHGDGLPVNGTGRKRDYDEFTKDDQSDQLSSLGPTPPPPARASVNTRPSAGAPNTRSSTPRLAKEPRPSRTRRTRVMDTSPQKPKDSATTAGVPGDARAGVDQDSAVANGEGLEKFNEETQHEEECRACGDVGRLLCCDGDNCPNSFHGDCLEPPVDLDDPTLDVWFCPECEKRQKPHEAQGDNQLMGALINQILTAPPRAYTLPLEVRNYFENVKTGDDGEYVETAALPTNKKGAPKADHHGALKPPNFKELKDTKGNTRFCYKCNGTTEGNRDIIPCDFCPHEWHLDCLNPPLATLPRRFDANGKPTQNWRCPLHVEHDLRNASQAQHAVPGQMGRKPRLRMPKKRIPVTPKEFIAQIPTNNGLIEPVLEPEEVELDLKMVEMNGQVFKIPEHKIKLDFIAKARREFYIDHAIPQIQGTKPTKFHSHAWTPDKSRIRNQQPRYDVMDYEDSNVTDMTPVDPMLQARADAEVRLQQKSFIEQQTALALLELDEPARTNSANNDLEPRDALGVLVKRLVADMPDDVATQINLSEQQQLEKLMDLAQQRLNILKGQTNLSHTEMDVDIPVQKNGIRAPQKSKVNGNTPPVQINGITLGHDHGDD